jgi:hypothetical protein
MPMLRILCYNGSLVFRTDVSLTTAKFKPLIFLLHAQVKVKVTLRLAVYRQSVCLGVKPLETNY